MKPIVNNLYKFKFAGSFIIGTFIEIKESYGNLKLYVFKGNDGFKYPIKESDLEIYDI